MNDFILLRNESRGAAAANRAVNKGDRIRIYNQRGEFEAFAHLTDTIGDGVVWMRDGWTGLNILSSGEPVVPAQALDLFPFTVGQFSFEATADAMALRTELQLRQPLC